MDFPCTIIEPGIGQWRSADIDEDELPTDLRFHDDAALSPLDAVFDARVIKVDAALDMAFLDLGNGLQGSLNFRRGRLLAQGQARSIKDCVKEGQLLRVQVVSEPSTLEGKALTVTPKPRLAGRYAVVESGKARLNFSKDLTAKRTKELKEAIGEISDSAAVIVRSRAGKVPVSFVTAEIEALVAALTRTNDKLGLVYRATPAHKALLALDDTTEPVFVEGGSSYAEVKALAAKSWPDLHSRIEPYVADDSAFETLGVEEAIEEALGERIELPSGGWISITPTSALTAVDVNMGGALKHMAAGEAKLVVNMEATLALAYHMRFQNIGGIVVVDYINMSAKGHTRDLMQLIERVARADSVPLQHTGLSSFGLVEFTRKRSGLSLRDRTLQHVTPRQQTAARGITLLREAVRLGQSAAPGVLALTVDKDLQDWLHANPALLENLEKQTSRTIELSPRGSDVSNATVAICRF
jgi:ribonuclease G